TRRTGLEGRVPHLQVHSHDRPALRSAVGERLTREVTDGGLDLRASREVLLEGDLPTVTARDPRRVIDHRRTESGAEPVIPDAHLRAEFAHHLDFLGIREFAHAAQTVFGAAL